MKKLFLMVFIFGGVIFVFGNDNTEGIETNNSSVVTGDWQQIEFSEIDEAVAGFIMEYLERYIPNIHPLGEEIEWTVSSYPWEQLVQGRRYRVYYSMTMYFDSNIETPYPVSGCLIIRKYPNGVISLEKNDTLWIYFTDNTSWEIEQEVNDETD